MSCSSNPAGSPITFDIQYFYNSSCFDCQNNNCPTTTLSSNCIYYLGPNLSCSGIETGDTVETALQKVDEQICSAIGDYSNYQFNCLATWFGQEITQESQFVNAITAYACEITETLEQFTGVTFPQFQSEVTEQFEEVSSPSLTCVATGVGASDDLNTILTKYCVKFGQLDSYTDISEVEWNSCLAVSEAPETIGEAFSLIVDQICQISAGSGGALPTFNNLGSCLSDPSANDSLTSTINKIKTRLCESPTWDADNISWGCVVEPSNETDLEEAIQNIVDGTNTALQNLPTFDNSDFVVTATNPSDPCAGVTVSLATPINQDRFVASDALDSSPGTLADKLDAGSNVSLDYSTPGKVIINASTGVDNYTVKASMSDSSPNFLDQKLEGDSDTGITLTAVYDVSTEKVKIIPQISPDDLFDYLLDQLIVGTPLYDKFCNKVAMCPCNCGSSDCTSYLVENESGETLEVSYVDCASGSNIVLSVSPTSSLTVCAKSASVVGLGLEITALGACPGGTTTTTTSTTTEPL